MRDGNAEARPTGVTDVTSITGVTPVSTPGASPDEMCVLDLVATVSKAAGPASRTLAPRTALHLVFGALRELGYGPDQTRAAVARGIDAGRASYGSLDLASEKRDLLEAAREELRDAAFYLAARLVQIERRGTR